VTSTAFSATSTWTRRHLVDAYSLTVEEILAVMAEAKALEGIKLPLLAGKVMANLFYENSTRTRTSFELAAKYLSAEVVNLDIATSSVQKGENLVDTVETLAAMGVDALVIRHPSSGVCQQLVSHFKNRVSIINAGDGMHEHPSQGLLDLYTMLEKLQTVAGKKIVIVGDILHSRVARSNLHILTKLGAQVHLVGPPSLLPPHIPHIPLDEALKDADVVMGLRLQLERQASGLIPSLAEYRELYGINSQRLELAKPGVLVMHPGPMNRGIEITSDVADTSLIQQQVRNGVIVRMAILKLLLQETGR